MECKKISVITVVFDDIRHIEKTICSVISQSYKNLEYIVIDGGSTDGTVDVVRKYEERIDKWISEPDKGIYDAMNKGVNLAAGDWLIFMNSGDCFANDDVIKNIFSKEIGTETSLIYSDFFDTRKRHFVNASFEKGILLHQDVIYRKSKHQEYGLYAVTEKYIVSDYLFFLRFKPEEVMKTNVMISVNDEAGVSNGKWCVLQKLCSDFVFRRISFYKLIIKLLYWNFRFIGKE